MSVGSRDSSGKSESDSIQARAIVRFVSLGDRKAQEDCILVEEERGIFVVADGFGGPLAGAAAAKASCVGVRNFLVKEAGDLDATLPFVLRSYYSLAGNVLFNALVHGNRAVLALNKDKGVHEKGGASAIAGFIDGDLLALANIGCCSAALIRDGELANVSEPRSYARLLNPQLGAGSILGASEQSVPLMSLGTADDLEPEITEVRVRPGDWLVLHTDGVSAWTRKQLCELQIQGISPEEASRQCEELLSQSHYTDNASLLLVIF